MLAAIPAVLFVATSDRDRSVAFYRDVLGLTVVSDEPFAAVLQLAGLTLRITPVAAPLVAPYTVLGWRVKDLRAMIESLGVRGVQFERFAGLEHDDLGACTFPGGSRVAWFKDPDGHLLSLTQDPPATAPHVAPK